MNRKPYTSPWDLAYELCKDHYTKEQIDEMALCEIQELINQE